MPKRTVGEPHSRLTRMSNRMMEAMDNDPEFQEGDKAIIFLHSETRSGIGIHGYGGGNPDMEAIADLFVHLKALFEVNGKTLTIIPLNEG